MKPEHLFLSIGALLVLACSSEPKATENMGAPTTTTVAPVDTVINRYERKENAQIGRDTMPVPADTGLVKVP